MTTKSKRDEFIVAEYQRLLNTLVKWTQNYDVARDIAQTTFATVLACPKFDPSRSDAFGFLKQKAWWHWMSYCRRKQVDHLPDNFPDPLAGRKQEMVEIQEAVQLAVTKLPQAKQEVIYCYLAGMPHAEIAADMGLSIKTVYSLFHQAKANLRQILQPKCDSQS